MSSSQAEVYQEAINRYFADRPNLDYLNLDLGRKTEISLKNKKFYCFESGFSHEYHTDNKQLNFICDLALIHSQNYVTTFDRVNIQSKVCLKHFYKIEASLESIQESIDKLNRIIKGKEPSHSSDTEIIERKIRDLPTRTEIETLIQSVFEKPKEIESESIKLVKQLEKKINRVEELVSKLEKHLL